MVDRLKLEVCLIPLLVEDLAHSSVKDCRSLVVVIYGLGSLSLNRTSPLNP